MTDNVIPIRKWLPESPKPKELPESARVSPILVEILEELLSRAKSGHILMMAGVFCGPDGVDWHTALSGVCDDECHPVALYGAVAMLPGYIEDEWAKKQELDEEGEGDLEH